MTRPEGENMIEMEELEMGLSVSQMPLTAMTDEEIAALKDELPSLVSQLERLKLEKKLANKDMQRAIDDLAKRVIDTSEVIQEQESGR